MMPLPPKQMIIHEDHPQSFPCINAVIIPVVPKTSVKKPT